MKIVRHIFRILWMAFVVITCLVSAISITIQLPKVQTFIAGKVLQKLEGKLDGEITVEKIHLKPMTTLVLKNVRIIDRNPDHDPHDSIRAQVDTFFRAEYITASFTAEGLFKQEGLHFRRAAIENAEMNLVLEDKVTENGDTIPGTNLTRIFNIPPADLNSPKKMGELFNIRKVAIRDMRFTMKNFHAIRPEHDYDFGMDWNDLDVTSINIDASDLLFKDQKMSGVLERMSFAEKGGFVCRNISGEAVVGDGRTIVNGINIQDEWSDINLSLFTMSYENSRSFKDFISEVRIDGVIEPSELDFTTITFFAPTLKGNDLKARISGSMSGYIDDFTVNDISIVTKDGLFEGTVNGRMSGLPDIGRTRLTAEVKGFRLTTDGLSKFVSEWMPTGELDIRRFAKDKIFVLDATADGLMNRMKLKADIRSAIGSLHADAMLTDIVDGKRPVGLKGLIETDDLDLGEVLGTDIIKETTLRSGLGAELGKDGVRLDIDSLFVERLHLNGYDYSDIAGKGTVSEKAFNGTIISNDPSLNFMIQGAFALSPKTMNGKYDFYAIVGHADLNAMNLDKRGISEIQFQTRADFTRTYTGDILGRIDIAEFKARNKEGLHDIGDVSLTSHSGNKEFIARLTSRFADVSYRGTAAITEFIKDIQNITVKKEIPALYTDPEYIWKGNSYDLSFKFHNSMDLLAYAMPGLYIADSTFINTRIDRDGIMDLSLKSSRIAFREQYLKGLSLNMDNTDSLFSGTLSCDEIKAAGLSLKDNNLEILADDNHIGLGYRYDNNEDFLNSGELFAVGDFIRDIQDRTSLSIELLPSMLKLNSRDWSILPSRIILDGKNVTINDLEIQSGEQRINLNGGLSKEREDTLTLNLSRFDISIANPLMKTDLGINGALSGKVSVTSSPDAKGLLADIVCDSTSIAGTPLGTLLIGSDWDNEFKRFDIALKNDLNGKNNINLRGRITPGTKDVRAYASLDRLNVGYVQPVLHDVFSEMDGYISGDIMLSGPLSNFTISSRDTRLDNVMLKIAYTNVPYFADGTFHLDNKGVYFDQISIKDRYDGYGSVTGSIDFDRFRDIEFNTRIRANNMECVDLMASQADVFYGNVFATGNIGITGPLNSILLSIDAVTTKSGQIHIPLSNLSSAASSTNLLKFTEPASFKYVDPYENMITTIRSKNVSKNELGLKMRVNATPSVEAFIEIDEAGSNVLSGRGSGMIDLEIYDENFSINGDYTLNSGNFHFNAANLAQREFQIQDGSSIRFNGDIMESTLDIEATYRTKTSIGTLIADTSSVSNRRTVDCGIRITDELMNPRLSFSIDIPDLDPTIKSRVESALSTEDKVQKQFLSLIITNSFLPDDQSGIVSNNSSMLYSGVTELMANQLSNILQKLDIPLDLGMKYKPNDKGNDIFDVAVSTQLFNNRVIVNGNIGNKQYSSGNQDSVVGDLDIEVKLDRSGSFRLNLFSHSADEYTNFLDNSQRNGVGLTYQTEFNSLRQFFRNLFSSKRKRTEARIAEEQAMIEEGRITIEIEKEKKDERE